MDFGSLTNRRDLFREALFLATAFVAACFFFQLRVRYGDWFAGPKLFEEIASRTGPKPWQYRILIPELANLLSHFKVPFIRGLFGWAKVLELGFLFLMVVAFRRYLLLFIKDRTVTAILSFLILLVLPFQYFFPRPFHANYWYDTPSIFFFTLGLTFLHQRKWALYYPLFIVATFNRETTCFLTMILLFTSLGKERLTWIAGHCAAQFVIWMSIKTVLGRIFLNNTGVDGFEWYDGSGLTHYADNFRYFMNPKNYPAFFSTMGYLWIPVLFGYHRIPNEFVRRSLWVVVPFFVGMFLVANIYELRLFVELVPLVLSAFFLILIDLIKAMKTEPENPGGALSE